MEAAKVGDLDEHRQAILARLSASKNGRPIWLGIHDDLYAALLSRLPAREDRDLDAPLFPSFTGRASERRSPEGVGIPGHRTSRLTASANAEAH